MSKFTPGPWEIDQYGHVYGKLREVSKDANGATTFTAPHICHVESVFDRYLISAAPDLFEALNELVLFVGFAISSGDWKVDGACDPDIALTRASKAIARAEGK